MATFVLAYRTVPGYRPTAESTAAWADWFAGLGDHLVDLGRPVVAQRSIGERPPVTELGGYSILSAPDLEAAVVLARGCPGLARGIGVEVGLLGEVVREARP